MFDESKSNRRVWIPHPAEGFVIGTINDIRVDSLIVQPIDESETVAVRYEDAFPAEDDPEKDVDDNCSLMYLNDATLLNNCRHRYSHKQIYTYVANILIAINPYEQFSDLYDDARMELYRGKSIGALPPHIFAIADNAYRDMLRLQLSQSIIVSGESGAGKTESQKHILRYLCHSYGDSAGTIEQRILETNPILESFGNAKTVRNNNSSRFGKFVEVHFGQRSTIVGGMVSHYLLEKSRICGQNIDERNYHIFYQLLAGADERLRKKLHLQPVDSFNYLNKGCTKFFSDVDTQQKIIDSQTRNASDYIDDAVIDDYMDFGRLISALTKLGLSSAQIDHIFECVATILHIGNIGFVEKYDDFKGKCAIDPRSESSLQTASVLIGVDADEMRRELLTRVMQPTKGGAKGTLYLVPLKTSEACAARDALAKAIYSRLFDKIVSWINCSIPFSQSNTFIGVLDAAGFESFAHNSFEQFCINFCNEKLQNFFNNRILCNEQELYVKEGLQFEPIEYSDNQNCIDMFEEKSNGLFTLLDDEARLPRPSPKHFTAVAHQTHQKSAILKVPRFSMNRDHRSMRDDDGFVVRHYAASVCYDTSSFLEKNNDSLHLSLSCLMEQSTNPLIADLFDPSKNPNVIKPSSSVKKLVAESISKKFRRQLEVLIDKLHNTGTHFVRCIKPNCEMLPSKVDGIAVLNQLNCAGMGSVVKVMQAGFPSRTSFGELYEMYRALLPLQLAQLDPRLFCKCLFHALGLNATDFAFGLTKVFFRAGRFAEFDQMLHQDKDEMLRLIGLAQSWLHCARWRRVQYGVLCAIKLQRKIRYRAEQLLKIQSHVRGMIVRRRHRPRLLNLRRVRALSINVNELTDALSELCDESRVKWTMQLDYVKEKIDALIDDIKNDPKLSHEAVLTRYNGLIEDAEDLLSAIRKQAHDEKNGNIRKTEKSFDMEEEQGGVRQRAAEAEKERNDEEVERLERSEEIREAVKQQASQNNETTQHSIANQQIDVEENSCLERRMTGESDNSSSTQSESKFDSSELMKWKYEDIRKAIATSKDAKFSAMCKDEYHRRVRAYYEWKLKNDNRRRQASGPFLTIQSPKIHKEGAITNAQYNDINERAQRFFKVPLSAAAAQLPLHFLGNVKKGMMQCGGVWYGHFDGRWIRREMIIDSEKNAVLHTAGKDNEAMCTLPLESTPLMNCKGFEIIAHQFDDAWKQCGGERFDYRM